MGVAPAVQRKTTVQRLRAGDYPRAALNNNGLTDLQNVRDSIVTALRANMAGMDWREYWGHITDHSHNTALPQGNASTFGGDTQAHIRAFIESVLNHYTPTFNDDRLVFDSTTGGVCNGAHRLGARTNVRVIVRVTDISDAQGLAGQVGYMVVENAYPIA